MIHSYNLENLVQSDFHDLREKHVVVTGGAGFIGSNLVDYLLAVQTKQVTVLDNLSTGKIANVERFNGHPSFRFIEGDIRNYELCSELFSNADLVSHQAALGSVPRSVNDPITTNDVNITGFLNVLVAAKNNNVDRVVFAASSSTYGDSTSLPKVEDKIGNPLSPYAVTKYVNELYAKVFHSAYGLNTIGLRYFNVFGPHQDPYGAYAAVIPKFILACLKNVSPTIDGDGLQTRDFTYIDNIVQLNVRALTTRNHDALNQIYNGACNDRVSVQSLWDSLNKISGKSIVPQYAPVRKGDVRDSLASIEKAKTLLGYEPKVKFEAGLQKTFEFFSQTLDY